MILQDTFTVVFIQLLLIDNAKYLALPMFLSDFIHSRVILLDDLSINNNYSSFFTAFFTELLDNSKQDLHEMFVKTYGLLYQQNSAVFTDLFRDLRSYYKGRDINLLDALDNFFSTLMQKMFQLMNTQYTFDQEYLQCVTERMDDLRPFGDVPQKLSMQVKRAFIAARTFVQGLAIGRDVILAVSKVRIVYTPFFQIPKFLIYQKNTGGLGECGVLISAFDHKLSRLVLSFSYIPYHRNSVRKSLMNEKGRRTGRVYGFDISIKASVN